MGCIKCGTIDFQSGILSLWLILLLSWWLVIIFYEYFGNFPFDISKQQIIRWKELIIISLPPSLTFLCWRLPLYARITSCSFSSPISLHTTYLYTSCKYTHVCVCMCVCEWVCVASVAHDAWLIYNFNVTLRASDDKFALCCWLGNWEKLGKPGATGRAVGWADGSCLNVGNNVPVVVVAGSRVHLAKLHVC